ncbi:MAG: ribosome biogenesis GTP-binding protein YihA/YsxC [Gammaproteobacteria bacterium]|nr:ribosome biogenesis GTP-binding protein YihA/YsxC [Gammaproteobacteria bacterium]
MTSIDFRGSTFLRAVARPSQLPPDRGAEVAFAGRSNAGKSTAINAITGRNALARTSKTPGRTQQIVFFQIDEGRRLADLPGYGFARVPERVRRGWAELMERYLAGRRSLKGVVLLTDARRPFTPLDRQLVAWCAAAGVPVHALLTKSDKLNRGAAMKALDQAMRQAPELHPQMGVQLFSGLRGVGVDAAGRQLRAWLGEGDA